MLDYKDIPCKHSAAYRLLLSATTVNKLLLPIKIGLNQS